MKTRLIDLLICPVSRQKLQVHPILQKSEEIHGGVLFTEDRRHFYPVVRGIPRLLPPELMDRTEFVTANRQVLQQLDLDVTQGQISDPLITLKQNTIEKFGFEWTHYDRHGWDDPRYYLQSEERVFREKSEFTPDDFKGKLVFDAGCGNGRYSHFASQYGAEVIALDLSHAVEAAYHNNRQENVHVIQGDLFHPPFSESAFDLIFSIGVLHHTGNTHRAFKSIARHLKPGGEITIHVYGTGNRFYEFFDRVIRNRTISMSLEQLQTLTSRMYRFSLFLKRFRLLTAFNFLVRLDYHPALIFDWYAAPIAQHHSVRELAGWCNEQGFTVTASHGGMHYWNGLHRLAHLICGGNTIRGLPVGVKAEKHLPRPDDHLASR